MFHENCCERRLLIISSKLLRFPTWVLDRVDGDLVVCFAGTQSRHHILDPPQLALHLTFLLLQLDIQKKTHIWPHLWFLFNLVFNVTDLIFFIKICESF